MIGGNARPFAADVSKASDAEGMVKFAEESFGRLDVIFNNAGIFHPNDESVTNTTEAIWDAQLDLNLKGAFFLVRAALPELYALVADRVASRPRVQRNASRTSCGGFPQE